MASNFYQNDSDGDSDNSFEGDDDDDDIFDGYNDFQPITEEMLTLVVTEGLDDIYTGRWTKAHLFIHLFKMRTTD